MTITLRPAKSGDSTALTATSERDLGIDHGMTRTRQLAQTMDKASGHPPLVIGTNSYFNLPLLLLLFGRPVFFSRVKIARPTGLCNNKASLL
jgi:hypothetical protein